MNSKNQFKEQTYIADILQHHEYTRYIRCMDVKTYTKEYEKYSIKEKIDLQIIDFENDIEFLQWVKGKVEEHENKNKTT